MRRTHFVASGLIGLASFLALSAPAFAAEYAAIAYDTGTGHMGWTWHAPSAGQAKAGAITACATGGCKAVIEIGAGMCGALATTPNGKGWGAASRNTRDAAELGAMQDCQKANSGQCKVQTSDCNQ
jgi:hypothetical protein